MTLSELLCSKFKTTCICRNRRNLVLIFIKLSKQFYRKPKTTPNRVKLLILTLKRFYAQDSATHIYYAHTTYICICMHFIGLRYCINADLKKDSTISFEIIPFHIGRDRLHFIFIWKPNVSQPLGPFRPNFF